MLLKITKLLTLSGRCLKRQIKWEGSEIEHSENANRPKLSVVQGATNE